LSPESYRAIARLAPRRRDLATLCLVSRAFSRVALPIMYNTLSVNDADGGARVCETLVASKDMARVVRVRQLHASATSCHRHTLPKFGWRRVTQCAFRLHTFHCDFDWDANLVALLDTQDELYDLYVRDFRDLTLLAFSPASASTSPPLLPALTTLECTFSEAAVLLAPGRPLSRLKTAFS
ncbi:hypothetical protein C8F01DRAFT_926793, partial [Mycena amicta]